MAEPSASSMAEKELAAAGAGQAAVRSAYLPQLGLMNTFVYNSPLLYDRGQFSHVALNGFREYVFLFDADWEIDLSGRLRAASALARSARGLAAADLSIARRDLRRAVAGAYYDLLLTRHIAEMEAEALKEAHAFEQRTRAMQKKGEASMADVHKAAAQSARFERRVSQAGLNARLANQVLASFWTTEVDRELDIVDAFVNYPELPAEATLGGEEALAAMRRRPEFERLRALQSGFRAQQAAARSRLRPQARVVFQYGLDSNTVRIADRGYAAFVHVDIPLFDWFGARSDERRARYQEERIEQQRRMTERVLAREVMSALANVKSSYEQILMARSERESAGESLRLAQLLYESGEGLALEVVAARVDSTDAGAAYFAAIAAYLRSLVELDIALGKQ